jgi:hypothetical protein
MLAINVFGFVLMVAVFTVVSSEVYALLHSVHYASKAEGSFVRRFSIGLARYEWASPAFHETACVAAGREPAYRASVVLGVWAAAVALMAFAAQPPLVVTLGGATLVAAGFGAAAYGRAFVAHRAVVREEIVAWASAAT